MYLDAPDKNLLFERNREVLREKNKENKKYLCFQLQKCCGKHYF